MENSSPPNIPPSLTPPLISPPPPSKPRKSRGWMIFAIILLVLLLFSIFGNFAQAISHALNFTSGLNRSFKSSVVREAAPKFDEWILDDNGSRNKIAVVTVDGIIADGVAAQQGNSMVDIIKAQLDQAKDDDHVRAGLLKAHSPRGEALASD